MRHHRSMTVCAMGLVLLGFTGCAGDSVTSSVEPSATSPGAHAEAGGTQPTPGEVQERAVPRTGPTLGITTPQGAPPRSMAPAVPARPAAPLPIIGHFAIQTFKGNFLTAVGGGGRITDVVRTDAKQVQSWETFRFGLDQYGWRHSIQTVNGHYLTAVGAGGKTMDAIHTDAVKVDTWEQFYIWKCGDLGSEIRYTISAVSDPHGFVFAYGGGGRVATHVDIVVAGAIGILTDYNLRPASFDDNWQRFRLMRQSDGSYALLISNGINYVTAIQGGGLAASTKTYEDLVTNRTQVQAWGKIRFVDMGDCSYAIQTVRGNYLGKSTAAPGTALGAFVTNVSDITNVTKFRLSAAF